MLRFKGNNLSVTLSLSVRGVCCLIVVTRIYKISALGRTIQILLKMYQENTLLLFFFYESFELKFFTKL